MESPTAKLNAYILQHQVKKMRHKPPYTSYNYRSTSAYSNNWIQDVLSMPITTNLCDKYDEMSSDSTDTLDLIKADPTGKIRLVPRSNEIHTHKKQNETCNCRDCSIDDNENSETSYCQCKSDAPEWVTGLMKEEYRPCNMTKSVELPDNYSLIDSTKKKRKKTKTPNKTLTETHTNTTQTPHQTHTNTTQTPHTNTTQTPQDTVAPTPDTANVMLLLQKAMRQLNEVKQAVEDTTVSAVTSDYSSADHTLTGLSAVTSDFSSAHHTLTDLSAVTSLNSVIDTIPTDV